LIFKMRKGMGRGTGKGYKNLVGTDKRIHSMSAKGIKQPQCIRVNAMVRAKKPKNKLAEIIFDKHFKDMPQPKDIQVIERGLIDINKAYEYNFTIIGKNFAYGVVVVKNNIDGSTQLLFSETKTFDSPIEAETYIKSIKKII